MPALPRRHESNSVIGAVRWAQLEGHRHGPHPPWPRMAWQRGAFHPPRLDARLLQRTAHSTQGYESCACAPFLRSRCACSPSVNDCLAFLPAPPSWVGAGCCRRLTYDRLHRIMPAVLPLSLCCRRNPHPVTDCTASQSSETRPCSPSPDSRGIACRLILGLLVVVLLWVRPALAQDTIFVDDSVNDGLVAHWKFDEMGTTPRAHT